MVTTRSKAKSQTIDFVMLFDGTGNDDRIKKGEDAGISNVVKLRDGLKKTTDQHVIYKPGIGNDEQWSGLRRWFAELTGWGGGWVMKEAYKELKAGLDLILERKDLKPGAKIRISTSGFSRGAALARDFVNSFIYGQLLVDYKQKFIDKGITFELGGVFVFDTVPSFGISANIWLLTLFGIYNQRIDIGWNFDIPEKAIAVHCVSIDEQRDAFTPRLFKKGLNKLEVWFAGDHSSVGGSYKQEEGESMGADVPLAFMAKQMQKIGLAFFPAFEKALDKYLQSTGRIERPDRSDWPRTQIKNRVMQVLDENGYVSTDAPIIHESVIRRMKADPNYRPIPIQELDKSDFYNPYQVLYDSGESKFYFKEGFIFGEEFKKLYSTEHNVVYSIDVSNSNTIVPAYALSQANQNSASTSDPAPNAANDAVDTTKKKQNANCP